MRPSSRRRRQAGVDGGGSSNLCIRSPREKYRDGLARTLEFSVGRRELLSSLAFSGFYSRIGEGCCSGRFRDGIEQTGAAERRRERRRRILPSPLAHLKGGTRLKRSVRGLIETVSAKQCQGRTKRWRPMKGVLGRRQQTMAFPRQHEHTRTLLLRLAGRAAEKL